MNPGSLVSVAPCYCSDSSEPETPGGFLVDPLVATVSKRDCSSWQVKTPRRPPPQSPRCQEFTSCSCTERSSSISQECVDYRRKTGCESLAVRDEYYNTWPSVASSSLQKPFSIWDKTDRPGPLNSMLVPSLSPRIKN